MNLFCYIKLITKAIFIDYKYRILDDILKDGLDAFRDVLIVGPIGRGKTITAKHQAKSF